MTLVAVQDADIRFRKLKWLCRRGMKELDVLLERFLDQNRNALCEGDWPALEDLLQNEDDVLWDWLQNPEVSVAATHSNLLKHIRRGT